MEHNSESYIVVKEFTDKGKTTREVIAKGVTKQGFIDAYTEKGCVMRGGENPHFEDIYSGFIYKLESHFEQGGRLNTYEDLSKEMPSVINENSTCIPIVDLALKNSNEYGSFLSNQITSSTDVKEAVDKILQRISGLENQDLVLTLLLSQNNKVKGYLFSYGSNPIEKNADKQDFFRQIVSAIPAGIISVVVGNTEKSNTNEWNYFSNGISKELSFFEIRNLDTLFYDYFGSKNSVSFADSGKMRSGGLVANSYPDLSKEMPSFVSEIDKEFSDFNKMSLVKKEKFCGEIPNKIERSFQAAKLFYSAWNKQKIGAVEEMFVLLLTATGRIISLYKHSLGARAGTILDNTIVSAVAVQSKAKGVIVCHNHPSGNLQPSQADIKVTRNLKEALFLCGINLVDSIIITPNENSYTSIFEEGLIMENGGEIIYADGGQVNRERDIEIAKTILMQLGGSNRLQVFTGAYNFVAVPYGVSFRIKNRSVNYVKIVLNAMDTYDVEFGRISGVNYKIVKELSGIYNDQLVEVFTRYTGMVLRFKKGGAIQGEENAEMVMNQNLQIRHHTEELEEILKSGKEVPAWVVSKISRAADSMSDATHYLEGTPDKMARGGGLNRMMANKFQKASFYFKELENRMSEKQKKFFNALLKRRQPSFEKNFTDTEIANYINGEIEEQFGIDLGIKKYDITGQNWFKLGFKFIAYRESIEEPDFWEDNPIPQNMPNPEPEPQPEPDFNIEQVKGEIEALKELLPFLEGDDKKEIEEQIDILSIALKQNENFGGGAEKEEIKQWYRINYPDDDLGNELNDAVTFEDLWNGLHNGSDVYEIIGVGDSDIRKNLFWQLSEIYGVDYNYVYLKWLDSDEPDAPNANDNFSQKVYIDFLNKKKGFKQDRIYFNSYEEAKDWAIKNFERFDPDMIKTKYAKGGGVGEPYDSMTKYRLEKELQKLTDEWFDIRKSYSTDNHPRQIEIDKEKDKIITLLYGENFSGVGQKFKYANGGGVDNIRVGSQIGFLRPHTGRYEWADVLSIEGDKVNLVVRHPKRSQLDNYFSETIQRITKFTNTESDDWKDSRPIMKIKYANGGGVGKEILDAEFWKDIAHLWRTRHIDIDKNGNWYNTEKYKGVNNTSGLYFTNESANLIVGLANSYNVTLLDIKNNNPNYTAFDYDKKRIEELRNQKYAKGGGVYDSADGISPAKQKAFNSLQNEGYFEKEAIEYVGGIKEWHKLSALEKEIIISDIEKDWSKSTFFAKGGGVGYTKKEILNFVKELKQVQSDIAENKKELTNDSLSEWEENYIEYTKLPELRVKEDFLIGQIRFGLQWYLMKGKQLVVDNKTYQFFVEQGFSKGGGVGTHIDLFEDYENMPPKIAKIFDKYSEDFEDGNYKGLSMALKEMQQLGYTFEYYLDGQAYGLRPIGVPLNQLKGYEDFEEDYAKGGEVGNFPPKGELKNKENLLLKYEKIGSDYEFFVYKPEKRDVSSYEQIKYVCVNKDCPTRMSYNQFLNYLYAETYLDDRKYAKGGEVFVCPVGTQIQSLIFDKSMFNLRQAKAWAKKNKFENDFVDGKLNTLRIRQKDPAMFTEDGFRTIQLRQGVQAVIGCPKKRTIRRKK